MSDEVPLTAGRYQGSAPFLVQRSFNIDDARYINLPPVPNDSCDVT